MDRCVSVHLTDLCNSKCTFCVVASPLYARDSVDYDGVVEFLTSNAGGEYPIVNIHGGEATIHPRFLATLDLIRDLGYREVHLQTNGIRLADPAFARACVDRNVRLFIVSLHGHVAELQDPLTHTPGGFEKTVVGIRRVSELGSQVRTNTVITRQNVRHLEAIAGLACELGVGHLNFSNLHPVGSSMFALDRTMASLTEIYPELRRAIERGLAAGRRVTLEGFPYCSVRDHVELNLNESYRSIRMLMRGQVIDDYDAFMNEHMRTFVAACADCAARERCGGIYPQYLERYGDGEFQPLSATQYRREAVALPV